MQRNYVLTYHYKGLSHTMELTQKELDNILAIGDAYPIDDSNVEPSVKYEIVAYSSDNRIWWDNRPLPSDVADKLLLSGILQIVQPSSPAIS